MMSSHSSSIAFFFRSVASSASTNTTAATELITAPTMLSETILTSPLTKADTMIDFIPNPEISPADNLHKHLQQPHFSLLLQTLSARLDQVELCWLGKEHLLDIEQKIIWAVPNPNAPQISINNFKQNQKKFLRPPYFRISSATSVIKG